MTTPSEQTCGIAPALELNGYTGSDDLLADLEGAHGEARRLLASGYAAAIRDAEVDPLTGDELLACLSGVDAGSRPMLAKGYALFVRDAMAASVRPSVAGSATLRGAGIDPVRPGARAASLHPVVAGARLGGRRSARATWLVLALCLSTAVAAWAVSAWRAERASAMQKDFVLSQQASTIRTLLLEERRYEKDAFINVTDRERTAAYAQKWYASRVALLDTITRTSELALTVQDREALREVAADFRLYALGFERVLSMIHSGRIGSAQEANERFAVYKDAVHRIEATCAEISARALQRIDKTI